MATDHGGREGEAKEFEAAPEGEQLALDNGREQLPWLESDDDYAEPGIDTGRIVAFAAILLVAIGLLVGGLWFYSRGSGDGALVADGSTIEAPAGPVKTRPEDPGGKTFEGTGDSSFAVAEGETREATLEGTPEPRPSIAAATVEETQASAAASPPGGGVGVQVAAYTNRAQAEQGWATLVRQHSALQGYPHRVVEGQADIGRVFRLQAVAADRATAENLCEQIRAQGGSCQVKP
ncbi:MAG TPA: SPOR domain-containing protein [Sphingomonadaceae bacterium]|nr:SPOR domain-containing protein [Sphingomonadaceae bacterium]